MAIQRPKGNAVDHKLFARRTSGLCGENQNFPWRLTPLLIKAACCSSSLKHWRELWSSSLALSYHPELLRCQFSIRMSATAALEKAPTLVEQLMKRSTRLPPRDTTRALQPACEGRPPWPRLWRNQPEVVGNPRQSSTGHQGLIKPIVLVPLSARDGHAILQQFHRFRHSADNYPASC